MSVRSFFSPSILVDERNFLGSGGLLLAIALNESLSFSLHAVECLQNVPELHEYCTCIFRKSENKKMTKDIRSTYMYRVERYIRVHVQVICIA